MTDTLEDEAGNSNGDSTHVGPIVFADADARRRLQQSGDVVTFRVSERTTGDTWWRKSRTGEKMGDCRVECIGAVDPSDRSVLMAYYREAGFDSVSDWQDAIADLNGELTEGYLYRVTSDEQWAECESCHEYSPEVEAVGHAPEYTWLCPECREPNEQRDPVTDGGVNQGDGDTYQCGNCGETCWGGSVSWWTDCEQCGASDWKQSATDDADLPRTNAGTALPELRFADRFGDGDDVFYAVTEENCVRLYRVTGETTIARSLLAYDAVIYETTADGSVTTASYNEQYGTIDLYHHMAGREASFRADRILDEPVITLAEVDRV